MIWIWNRDSLSLPLAYVSQFDVMITDPPYREHVHVAATSQSPGRGTRKRDLGFDHLSRTARRAVANWTACVRRWSVVYSDVESSNWLNLAVQARKVEYVRTIPWVRWSMPQLSGDRPPQGFEHVMLYHPKGKKRWNGPGNLTHLAHLALRGEEKHRCEKPLDQALDLVSWFSDIGETVFDPFAGHGTIGLACRLLGRHYVGFEYNERDPVWAQKAAARLKGPISDRDRERIDRWLASDSEPASAQTEGPSLLRAQSRAFDKENVKTGVFLRAA